jgi:hypothetical protein
MTAAVKNFLMALSPIVIIRKSRAQDLELQSLRFSIDSRNRIISQIRYENEQMKFNLDSSGKQNNSLLEAMYIQSSHAGRALAFIEAAGLNDDYQKYSESHSISITINVSSKTTNGEIDNGEITQT